MQRIDALTVRLSAYENLALGRWDQLLDLGRTCEQAVEQVRLEFPGIAPEFFVWLGKEVV